MLIGIIIFTVIGYFMTPFIYAQTHSAYDRKGIERVCDEMFGNTSLMDALTEEIMIVSYDYNERKPRIFTKYGARIRPDLFLTSLSNASQASSAAPTYFDPKVLNGSVLVDGGIIANNPSLYAYLHSKDNLGKKNIRMISIGTGSTHPDQIDPKKVTIFTWFSLIGTLLTVTEQ